MKSNAYKPGLRVELTNKFRKELFRKLLKKYSYRELIKLLDISHGMLYHYKNKRVKTIPLAFLEKLVKIVGISKSELLNNIKRKTSSKELRQYGLRLGQEIRHKQLRSWQKELPDIHEIMSDGYLDLEKWFNSYRKLFETAGRKIRKMKRTKSKLKLNYCNFVKGELRNFTKILPRKIVLDEDFQYFFGLWCGDRAGGGRVGILNKSEELLIFTNYYLKKIHQKSECVILKSDSFNELPRDFQVDINKIIEVKDMQGTYVLVIYTVNGILKRFFDYLEKNLDEVLTILPDKNIFFAGLFDAEGNVFFEDRVFRWACKHSRRTKVYTKHLKSLDLFNRYDGSCLISRNSEAFKTLILPYLKQQDKVSKASILCGVGGHLDKRFKQILSVIAENPGLTNNDLVKLLKLKKAYSQINFLEKFGYISRFEYPKKVKITKKGMRELEVI